MNFGNCVGLWTLLFAEWSYISHLYQVGFFVSNTDSVCFMQEEETYGEESMEGQAGQPGLRKDRSRITCQEGATWSSAVWTELCISHSSCLSCHSNSCVRNSDWKCLHLDRPMRNRLGRGVRSLKDGLLIKNKDVVQKPESF